MSEAAQEKVDHLLRTGLGQLGIRVTETALGGLVRYCLDLEKWNRRVNLVARNTSLADIVEKHFLDSLTLLPLIQKYGLEQGNDSGENFGINLLDVGTGAGFPGLVLATALASPTADPGCCRCRGGAGWIRATRGLAAAGTLLAPHRQGLRLLQSHHRTIGLQVC